MFTSIPNPRTSEAVEAINVNPFTRVVNVRFTNGYEYKYSNVSRAKIVNLMLNPNMEHCHTSEATQLPLVSYATSSLVAPTMQLHHYLSR